jgi:hypothetical protein
VTAEHAYLSTACRHDKCGVCRQTCKYCGASCLHGCHPEGVPPKAPASWVDQARGMALRILAACYAADVDLTAVDRHLASAIATDPSLFWLRGEEQPGECRDGSDQPNT